MLCLSGVGVLEGILEGGMVFEGGDFWAVMQAVGFGTSFFLTEVRDDATIYNRFFMEKWYS